MSLTRYWIKHTPQGGNEKNKKKKKYCPKCGKEVSKETDKDLKKEYPYACLNCDENFYGIEVEEKDETGNG